MWIPHSQGRFHFTDAKLIGLIMVWLIYGISLLLRERLGWQGQRMAVLFTLGFLFSFLSMTVLNLFSPRFHSLN
jgi:ABC-type transport system involved in cytochrome c biogenesis permease subunit